MFINHDYTICSINYFVEPYYWIWWRIIIAVCTLYPSWWKNKFTLETVFDAGSTISHFMSLVTIRTFIIFKDSKTFSEVTRYMKCASNLFELGFGRFHIIYMQVTKQRNYDVVSIHLCTDGLIIDFMIRIGYCMICIWDFY